MLKINIPPAIDFENGTWTLTFEGKQIGVSPNLDSLRNVAPTAILTTRAEAAIRTF